MVLKISISAEAEAQLKEKAAAAGVDVETYAVRHLELMAASPKSLIEISRPIGEAFATSGMSEDELSISSKLKSRRCVPSARRSERDDDWHTSRL